MQRINSAQIKLGLQYSTHLNDLICELENGLNIILLAEEQDPKKKSTPWLAQAWRWKQQVYHVYVSTRKRQYYQDQGWKHSWINEWVPEEYGQRIT